MKNLDRNQILLAGAIALGLVAIGKLVYDINKIRKLTAEKEEALAEEAVEEIPATEEAVEEIPAAPEAETAEI